MLKMKTSFWATTLLIIGLLITWLLWRQPMSSQQAVDLRRLPIGDGRVVTSPQVGAVWSCRPSFGGDGIGGAHAAGEWIHADGTYDFTAKPTVDGAVKWPSKFQIELKNQMRQISGNRLPQDPTGEFPVSPQDDAYAYDRNPNSIAPDTYKIDLPAIPQIAPAPSCLPLGEIGVLLNGGYFFNALDAGGKDAVAHEIQDNCQGHPEITGAYHYHSVTTCLEPRKSEKTHSALVGYAHDGFGIYGHRGEQGKELTNADLDVCHGHSHEIDWDNQKMNLYHYHATWEYPYTVGCYRGTPLKLPRKLPPHPVDAPPFDR
jgi:YHYH protein